MPWRRPDLLGQMAAPDYIDKLPVLYQEFAEAMQFDKEKAKGSLFSTYSSSKDLMRQTPRFWSKYVRPKLQVDFQELYTFLNDPYPMGLILISKPLSTTWPRLAELLKS